MIELNHLQHFFFWGYVFFMVVFRLTLIFAWFSNYKYIINIKNLL